LKGGEKVNVHLKTFPEELHYAAKMQALVERISLKDLIIKAVAEYLERVEQKGDKK
jgi:predicted HicB family RNase H-like nuclease